MIGGLERFRDFFQAVGPDWTALLTRRHLGEVFRKLAEQKECRIEEGHMIADHVHILIAMG